MTVREFIAAHPGEGLDLMTPEGTVILEATRVEALLAGKAMIAWPGTCKKAVYVQAKDLLEQTVCSAARSFGRWKVYASYDPWERKARKNHPGMMKWRCT